MAFKFNQSIFAVLCAATLAGSVAAQAAPTAVEATATADSIGAQLFYKYPVAPFPAKIVDTGDGQGYSWYTSTEISKLASPSGSSQWSLHLIDNWSGTHADGKCAYTWNLETGVFSFQGYDKCQQPTEKYGEALLPPEQGGNVDNYSNMLDLFSKKLDQTKAPQQALDYVANVKAHIDSLKK